MDSSIPIGGALNTIANPASPPANLVATLLAVGLGKNLPRIRRRGMIFGC